MRCIRKTEFTQPILIVLEFRQLSAHSLPTKKCEIIKLTGSNADLLEMISIVSFDLWSKHFSQRSAAVVAAELSLSASDSSGLVTWQSMWSYLSFQYSSNS